MAQYINKATVVAEIDRRIKENKADIQRAIHKHLEEYFEGYEDALVLFKEKFIDTLEVKEVDLEKEANEAWDYIFSRGWDENSRMALKHDEYIAFAKHFYELGLNAKEE